jgi:osmotically-inducible protein OsmY
MKRSIATVSLIAFCSLAVSTAYSEESSSFEGEAKDAWLTGRIESMYLLNEHLNPFQISTNVENGTVYLTGTVDTDVDKDLAAALAKNLEGVVKVENELMIDATAQSAADTNGNARRDFGTWVDDATTTAAVKSRLVGNSNTKGLQIDVDTNQDIVTLSGSVETEEEKALAEEIARLAKDVEEVRNNLVVDPSY